MVEKDEDNLVDLVDKGFSHYKSHLSIPENIGKNNI